METPNPTMQPPSLRPAKRSSWRSISPLPSPVKTLPFDGDALLQDLSPSTTLRAFTTGLLHADPQDGGNLLRKSVERASKSERVLGAKAAQACVDVRAWTREVESWEWPGTFEEPESDKKVSRLSAMKRISSGAFDAGDEFWGSLPAQAVEYYEKRVDLIERQLDDVDIEDLKQLALAAHHRVSQTLDDLTVVITATVLQVLPYLSKLGALLRLWTMRLRILRQVPAFLADLTRARRSLDACWAALGSPDISPTASKMRSFHRIGMIEMKSAIETELRGLGMKIDCFLDDVEGRGETIPDVWIDHLEKLERSYSVWVVQAERNVLEKEWRQSNLVAQDRKDILQQAINTDHEGTSSATPGIEGNHVTFGNTEFSFESHSHRHSDEGKSGDTPDVDRSFPPEEHLGSSQIQALRTSFPTEIVSPVPMPQCMELPLGTASHRPGGDEVSTSSSLQGLSSKSSESNLNPKNSNDLIISDTSHIRLPSSIKSSESVSLLNAKKRAAFLKSHIERNRTLQITSHTPVRRFEHASNAFAKLFKGLSPEQQSDKTGEDGVKLRSKGKGRPRRLVIDASENAHKPASEDLDAILVPWPSGEHPVAPRGGDTKQLSSPFQSPGRIPGRDWPLASPERSTFLSASSSPQMQPFSSSPPSMKSQLSGEGRKTTDSSFSSSSQEEPMLQVPGPLPDHGSPVTAPFEEPLNDRTYHTSLLYREEQEDGTQEPDVVNLYDDHSSPTASPTSGTHYVGHMQTIPSEMQQSNPNVVDVLGRNRSAKMDRSQSFGDSASRSSDALRPTTSPSSKRRSNILRTASDVGSSTKSMISEHSVRYVDPSLQSPSPTFASLSTVHSRQRRSSLLRSSMSLNEGPLNSEASMMVNADEAPLNAFMPKSRTTAMQGRTDTLSDSNGDKNTRIQGKSSHSEGPTSLKTQADLPNSDNFDRHVSEVLERVHAPIKFRAAPSAMDNDSRTATPDSKALFGRRGLPKGPSLGGNGSSMLLSPAETSPRKPTSKEQPEVKLYHLTQAGRDEPIKLFVRLVGENERVMVRVGGGWADLSEYLKQYAEHHGSRTISEGAIEVTTADSHGVRKVSGNMSSPGLSNFNSGASRPVGRPISRDSSNDEGPKTPRDDFSSAECQSIALMQTPVPVPPATQDSRPATSEGSGMQEKAEGSLAGPASGKKGDLSDRKAKWVEGMIEQAKSQSAEKNKTEKTWTALSKAGGTRRLIFRSASGATPGSSSGQ